MDKNKIMKKVLEEIDFINRYNSLLEKYSIKSIPFDMMCNGYSVELVIDEVESLGYKVKFNKRERFFNTNKEQIDGFVFFTHFVIRSGIIEMFWDVKYENKNIVAKPIHWFSKHYLDKPTSNVIVYSEYEQLEEIFTVLYKMYEDFKVAFLEAVKENCEYKNKME